MKPQLCSTSSITNKHQTNIEQEDMMQSRVLIDIRVSAKYFVVANCRLVCLQLRRWKGKPRVTGVKYLVTGVYN